MPIIAGIDIGTNTVRLLIADVGPARRLRRLYEAQQITRLGEGCEEGPEGSLRPQAVARTITALKAFRRAMDEAGVETVVAVATSAVREAGNRAVFLRQVRDAAGLDIEVLSGEEEARRTYCGAAYGVGGDPMLLMDIGGGSTEFIKAEAGRVAAALSAKIGTVRLTERHLRTDPPTPAELRALRKDVADLLHGTAERLGPCDGLRLVGTAGTVTTLAAVSLGLRRYDVRQVHGMTLTREAATRLWDRLKVQSVEDRLISHPVLERGRADVIVAGAAIVEIAMTTFGFDHLLVSDDGLREGIILARLGDQWEAQAS